eukprot:3338468-Rhodomonas_salina.2
MSAQRAGRTRRLPVRGPGVRSCHQARKRLAPWRGRSQRAKGCKAHSERGPWAAWQQRLRAMPGGSAGPCWD